MSMLVIIDSLLEQSRSDVIAQGSLPASARPALHESLKRALDCVLAVVLLVLTFPLHAVAILLIKLTSPGPAFYSQTRIGRNGVPFTIYKLRSMTYDCESLTGAQWCKPGDTRITTVGRWLRKTHIDELPQLWNVLRGDMSLIGPRPERPEFFPQLEQAIRHYRDRLKVRPGVTGLAQVQLPPDTDLESVRLKLAYELHYIRNMGLFLDMVIHFATLLKVLGVPLAAITMMCRFQRREVIEREYAELTVTMPAPAGAKETTSRNNPGVT